MPDPDYIYRPWSEQRREAASRASLARLGVPPGHRLVYGVPVPLAIWEEVRAAAVTLRHRLGMSRSKVSGYVSCRVELWRHK